MSTGVFVWWILLCAVGTLNILAWTWSARALARMQGGMSGETFSASRVQLLLSAGYVFGCAFRSAIPVFDVPRQVMFDSWLSSIVVGRSVATVAELCFVAQWAMMLRGTAQATGSVVAAAVSRVVFPLIVVAEICSWYSVLTTSNLGHVIEESLWGFSAVLLLASLVGIWQRCARSWRPAIVAGSVACVAYIAYMFLVDVPMYWSRWLADEAAGRTYLSFMQGLMDVSERRVVAHHWDDWKSEMPWMTLYFSVAVWISILLIHTAHRAIIPKQPKHLQAPPSAASDARSV